MANMGYEIVSYVVTDVSDDNGHVRRADIPRTGRGDAAADVAIPWETSRGGAAAATWLFLGRVAATPRPRRGYS